MLARAKSYGSLCWDRTTLPEGKRLAGNSGSAGPTATGGRLVFVGATDDRRFRAFDAKTGKEVWTTQLEANANANPMSYRARAANSMSQLSRSTL